jgi:tRNA threonylcarbamoyl adenosine modification protein YeaZ
MSNYLAVDTSSKHLTVIAKKGDVVVKRFIPDCALNHSVLLMDEVDKAMTEAHLKAGECDYFAAVTGPGSFTGIRIGISTVKGFAVATGKPMLAVTSFDLTAYNVTCDDFVVAIDAAHGFYYVCGYGKNRVVTLEPCYMSEQELINLGKPIYGHEDLTLPAYTKLQADTCLHPAICALECNLTDNISALYVRKSQAEEGRK